MAVGTDWGSDRDGNLLVPAGGPRLVEALGDGGAVALLFGSHELGWRHGRIREAGASHDWPEYQPHVTITWAKPDGLDLARVEPFAGPLKFGPELFSEVDDDWRAGVVEDREVGDRPGRPFEDGKRGKGGRGDKGGQFAKGGGRHPGQPQTARNFVAQSMANPKNRESFVIGHAGDNTPEHARGYVRAMNAQEIRKNMHKHGNPARLVNKQPAITGEDFENIGEVTSSGTFQLLGGVEGASRSASNTALP